MVVIKQQIVPQANRHATFGTGNPKKKLVVHQTGNRSKGANAQMHANLQSRGWRNASWHIQSDDKEIIQSWPFDYRLWHDSTGDMPNGGNFVGIGWEICINSDGDYLKSLELAAKGIAQVMRQEGIPMSGLTTHNAEDPKNKWCPAQILSGWHGITWPKFKEMVRKAYEGKTVTVSGKPTPKPKKSNEEVAREVFNGKWGNNPKRRNDLISAGYNYNTIQSLVDDIAEGNTAVSAPKAQPATQTLFLPATAETWRVYRPSGPYTVGNERGFLAPKRYGGLSYPIKGTVAPNVYLIDTQDLGRVAIYAHPSTGARITGGVQKSVSKPKPQPKAKTLHLPASAKLWKIYRPNGPYTAGNEIHNLTPSAYGGLTYEVKGNPAPHVYLIDTSVKGRVAIYAHPSTGATIK